MVPHHKHTMLAVLSQIWIMRILDTQCYTGRIRDNKQTKNIKELKENMILILHYREKILKYVSIIKENQMTLLKLIGTV